jgi:hypothetical protein
MEVATTLGLVVVATTLQTLVVVLPLVVALRLLVVGVSLDGMYSFFLFPLFFHMIFGAKKTNKSQQAR